MNNRVKIAVLFLIIINSALLAWAFRSGVGDGLEKRMPGMDDRPDPARRTGPVTIDGELTSFDVQPPDISGRWVQFRNSARDGIAREEEGLARQWPEDGPPVRWSIGVGDGYASAAILDGRVYMIDYDRENQGDLIRCLSLETGEDIWQYFYPVQVRRNHGMSRTVPAATEDFVVTLGPKAHVTCLDARTGEFLWMLNLEAEYGTDVPPWYAGQCPYIDAEGRVILAPAGDEVLMMAVEGATGEVVWETPNEPGWDMTHSSIVPMEFGGRKTYVYCGSNGVAGICAGSGELLWRTGKWRIRIANIPSPVIVGDDRIFFTGGYNAGSMMLRLVETEGGIEVREEFRRGAREFASEQQTPILYEGHIYAVRPDGELACMDTDGNVLWTSGGGTNFGLGPLLIADGLIYVMDDNGVLTMAEAVPSGYNELARSEVMDGHEAWGPMAIADGRLIVRDMNRMLCLDLKDR